MARARLVRIFIAFVRVGNLGWDTYCLMVFVVLMEAGKWITKVTILRSLCMDDFSGGGFEIWQHCEAGVGFLVFFWLFLAFLIKFVWVG